VLDPHLSKALEGVLKVSLLDQAYKSTKPLESNWERNSETFNSEF